MMVVKKELKIPMRNYTFAKVGIAVCVATVFLCASVRAALTSIVDPLVTVNLSETWQSFPNYQTGPSYLSATTPIMGGDATISNPYMQVYEPTGANFAFGLGSSGLAQVKDGSKAMGLNNSGQTATIVFSKTVFDFGAYWGAATDAGFDDPATISLVFNGSSGSFTDSFTYSRSGSGDGLLEWHGWHSDVGITSMTYTGDYVVIDGLQAYAHTPEPSTILAGALLMIPFGLQGVRWLRNRKQGS